MTLRSAPCGYRELDAGLFFIAHQKGPMYAVRRPAAQARRQRRPQ
ncbi:hypothetical protein ACNTMW_13440 [Planosporangium sp. 12N6]